MLRWSADKVLPQRFQLSFDGRGLGVRCYEPHPGVNACASVASPFIWPCEPQNAFVTWFWFLCALLRTAQKTMIVLQNRLFFALASRSGFGASISDPVARSSIVFCNSVSADRIVMAASRLLRAVAAFVILLSFAARLRKSYWSGCMKAATVICQQIFSILALVIFLLKKVVQNRLFFALASRSGFGAAISDPVARSSIVFCNSVFADRIVMAASRLLFATAACVILLSFAARLRKSYWSGCRKAATVICQQISSILALVIFLLKILLKSASKSSFFRFGVEIRFWASRSGFGPAIYDPVARSSIVFCNSVFADRIVMAASRLLGAAAACVILLFFAAGLCKSYWSGCMKAATVICQQMFSILALVIFLLKILLKSASKSSFFRSGVEIRFWTCNFRPSCA